MCENHGDEMTIFFWNFAIVSRSHTTFVGCPIWNSALRYVRRFTSWSSLRKSIFHKMGIVTRDKTSFPEPCDNCVIRFFPHSVSYGKKVVHAWAGQIIDWKSPLFNRHRPYRPGWAVYCQALQYSTPSSSHSQLKGNFAEIAMLNKKAQPCHVWTA